MVRRRLKHFNDAASKIQSYFKMTLHREVFLMIKRNVEVLQRGVRRYLARRDMIQERMRKYLTQQY